MDELIKQMKELLANTVTMYLKASGFHWNVEGENFAQFHDFFGDIYADVYNAIDPTAENLRKLNVMAPHALGTLDSLRSIEDQPTSSDPIAMCVALVDANDMMLLNIAAAYRAAAEMNEQGICNFLADRDSMHKKWRWQLDATIKRRA